jgi:hypothetical protein
VRDQDVARAAVPCAAPAPAGHRRYPITSCNMDTDSEAGSDAEEGGRSRGGGAGAHQRAAASARSLVRGGGVENAVRILRLNYEMLDCPADPGEVE